MTKLENAQRSGEAGLQTESTGNEAEKLMHLTQINMQLEDHVTSLDAQLEQLQHELEAAGSEAGAAASQAQAKLESQLEAQRAQHEASIAQHRAQVEAVQEDCSSKALQVCPTSVLWWSGFTFTTSNSIDHAKSKSTQS